MTPHRRIRQLDDSTARELRALTTITSLPDAIREVLHNALDASACRIQLQVDIGSMSFTVSDDGAGIHPDDISSVCRPAHTSKTGTDVTIGYRGLALAAIASISNLSLVSKVEDHNGSYYTRWHGGECVAEPRKIGDDVTDQRRIVGPSGTIVKVKHMFYNVPARLEQQKKIAEFKVLNEIRQALFESVLVNPKINMTVHLVDGGTTTGIIANIVGCKDVSTSWQRALNSIFGISLDGKFVQSKTSLDGFKTTFLFGALPVLTKSYQFVSLNGPLVEDEELKQFINRSLAKTSFGASEEDVLISSMSRNDISPKKGRNPTKTATIVGNSFRKHAVFILKVDNKVDISSHHLKSGQSLLELESVKTQVVFGINNFIKRLSLRAFKAQTPDRSKSPTPELAQASDSEERQDKSKVQQNVIGKAASYLAVNSRIKLGALREKELNGMMLTRPSENSDEKLPNKADPLTIQSLIKGPRLLRDTHDQLCLPTHQHEELTLDQLREVNIQRDLLSNCTVISQVDTKFILLKGHTGQGSLYLVDQHACDERIRVEALFKSFHNDALENSKDMAVPVSGGPIFMRANQTIIELLNQFKEQLSTWGIKFKIHGGGDDVQLTHLPEIMHVKVDGDNTFISKCVIQYLYDLQNNTKLKTLSDDWWLSIQSMPQILVQLINSKACRSAIMFGDQLSRSDCELLVRDLAQCKQPFQCAHGRPSIVPICDLAEQYSI
ncbi:CYFA0S06e00760g1_1 [Cyberlindnera fabianii]|uniref:CYFA0S06e00760g1_1 n=1 Tax=Cyberlindnera fabianii TaxID=36022 RepID=A0A061AU38_CYBFA|nr:CYFA0S06e00760g1_1 [Cyberlindnera fabianii]